VSRRKGGAYDRVVAVGNRKLVGYLFLCMEGREALTVQPMQLMTFGIMLQLLEKALNISSMLIEGNYETYQTGYWFCVCFADFWCGAKLDSGGQSA